MAFDGIVLNALSRELKKTLVGTKIDKVHQPEKDEICLKIRTRESNIKLVISSSASNPRVYIAKDYEKSNPKKAPVFCMTLRKYIQNGVITDVEQIGFERIMRISVESYDELREKTTKYLYIEIMGKHSNIILVSKNERKILDSIKRIPLSVSRVRQILPGMEYELPPGQDKINPLEGIDVDELTRRFEKSQQKINKAILSNILGVSPLISNEICYRLGIDVDLFAKDAYLYDVKRIADEVNGIFSKLDNDDVYPNMVIDTSRNKIVEFGVIELSQYKDCEVKSFDSISEVIENYYISKDKKERISQKSLNLRKNISIKLERLNNKIKKQMEELRESEKAEEFKIKGELITSYIYMIKQGMESVSLCNFYDDNNEVNVQLKKNLTPSENAQKYFKKYNKLKKANEELTKFISENTEEAEYLENILLAIENCENEVELKEIREELIREGYVRAYKIPKKNVKPVTEFKKYLSSNGNLIIVGKNNKQNDYLTLRLADNEDLWFHTKDIPGSHVVIKSAGKKVGEEEIFEAALLAAFFSKARLSSKVPVDYTLKKNVRKPSGAKPGLVIYDNNRTVYVTPSDEAIAKIRVLQDDKS